MDDLRRWIAEAGIGLFIALVLLVVVAVSATTVHFVYQGF